MTKYTLFLVTALFALASFLRFYHISVNPPGLYWDEASIGYNAHSIFKTGRDEHGESFPLAFKSFGDYKLPAYIYTTAFSIALFGPTELAVRFPSAVAGTLTVILIYFLVLELFGNRRLATLAALFLAISPWHLQFSRAGFEANLALFFIVSAAIFMLKSEKRPFLLLPSSLLFSVAIYTYPTARLFVPLLIFVSLFVIKKSRISKRLRWSVLFFSIFGASYLLIFFLPHLLARFNPISAFNGYSFNQWPYIFFRNFLSYFSFDFLFFHGDQIPRHNLKDMGNLYFFEIPLLLIGFYQLLKVKMTKAKIFILGWLLLSPLAASLTQPSPHSLRSLNMVIPSAIISALGLLQVISWLEMKVKIQTLKRVAYLFIVLIIFYFFINYQHRYFSHYPKISGLDWQEGNKEMAQEVLKREKDYRQIFVSDFLGNSYLYLLFYGQIDSRFYLTTRTADGFGKYHFINQNWTINPKGKTLWVLSFNDKFEPDGKLLKEIRMSNGDSLYRLWETD